MSLSDRTRKIARSLFSYTMIYLSLLLCLGYYYGSGDLIEIQPYWDAMIRPENWVNDFFVGHQLDRVPNERFLFVWLLSLTGPPSPYVALACHFLTSLLLIHGMKKLSAEFIGSPAGQIIAILAMCLGLYGINTGGNELYYPLFTNSYLAQALGIWVLWFWLKNYKWALITTLILTAFVHILIGLQLLVLIFISLTIEAIVQQRFQQLMKRWWLPKLIWVLTAGIYFVFLFIQVSEGDIEASLQLEIMEFRLSHHFFPSYFPMKSWVLVLPLTLFGILFFMKKDQRISYFYFATIAGALIYTAGIYWLRSTLALSTQWFEATIWIEYFSVIAISAYVFQKIKFDALVRLNFLTVSTVSSVLLILIAISPLPIFESRTIGEPIGKGPEEDIEIARMAAELSGPNSVFALPPYLTAFKWYAKRPSYVDYKAMIHHKEVMPVWYERVKFLYGLDITDRREQIDMYQKADKHLTELFGSHRGILKSAGITHVILPRANDVEDVLPIASNEKFAVYRVE